MSDSGPCNCDQSLDLQESIDFVYQILKQNWKNRGRSHALLHLEKKVSKKVLLES